MNETKRDRALSLVAYRHGLRASEVGMLHRAGVDMKSMRIMIHRLKGSRPGVHQLQADEARLMKAYINSRLDNSKRISGVKISKPRGVAHAFTTPASDFRLAEI